MKRQCVKLQTSGADNFSAQPTIRRYSKFLLKLINMKKLRSKKRVSKTPPITILSTCNGEWRSFSCGSHLNRPSSPTSCKTSDETIGYQETRSVYLRKRP